jgi:hypothetical protein
VKTDGTQQRKSIEIHPPEDHFIELGIRGTKPLLANNFDEETKLKIQQKAARHSSKEKAALDVDKECAKSERLTDDGVPAHPTQAFITCAIEGWNKTAGLPYTKKVLEGSLAVVELLTPITFKRRANFIRPIKGKLSYGIAYYDWSTTIKLQVVGDLMDDEQLANAINTGGARRGVGANRGKGGYGRFIVEQA